MAHDYADIARQIGEPLLRYADEDAYFWFMEGVRELAEVSDEEAPAAFAQWLKAAVDRLDMLVDRETAVRVMQRNGRICADMHRDHGEDVLRKRRQCKDLAAYIEAEAGLTREGDVVYSDYGLVPDPEGVRCYCSFWHPMPKEETVSPTWCNCAAGHAAAVWDQLVGEPVRVEVLESCMSGGDACRFAIHLPDGWRESEPRPAEGATE